MEKIFIKITLKTKKDAIKKIEELWYKEYINNSYNWEDIIKWYSDWDWAYTFFTTEDLIERWYKEVKLEEFELWEQVATSNTSKEDAINCLLTDAIKYYYTWWINKDWDNITERSDGWYISFKYIAKIPKKKKVTLELTDEQLEKIKDLI